jgi:type 2 lantibiotic biosynthesis protein LanM
MMYEYLIEKREALFKTGLLADMSKQKVRFVFRNTEMYGNLARQAMHPRYLSDGVDHQIQLDILSKALLLGEEKVIFWPIVKAEYTSLKQQDIPFFMAYPQQDSLQISADHWIPGYFAEPSYKQVVARLESFNEFDLNRQVMLICTSFQAHVAHKENKSLRGKPAFQLTLAEVESATPEMMMKAADEIARLIYKQAIISEDGSTDWVGMKHYIEANRYQLEPLGHDLYDGNTGIALFLAAMDKISGRPTYRDFILNQALYSLRNLLRNPASATAVKRLAERSPIGGAIGTGSLAYALTKISQLLGEEELLEDAVRAGLLITPELITADRRLDLLLGAGGALLSLLAVFEATRDERMKDLALLCGEHLLAQRRIAKTGHYAWPANAEGRFLTGFSHGAAGIAYSLLRLYDVTQDERFLAAAKDGIAYEQAVFSVEENNWPDWRRWETPKYDTIRWCSGAPGIGLSRLVGLPIWDTEEIRNDISRAVDITCKADFHSTDHPCCGNLGRAEIMMEIAKRSNDVGLLEDVHRRVGWVLARKQFNGKFSVSPFFDDLLQPSFFQGVAGIGYSLLRIVDPEALPLILAWE